jgi:hypothetical protein
MVVFLGIIAFASLVQTALLVALALLGLRAAHVFAEIRTQAREELVEPMAHLKEATRHLKETTAELAEEARVMRQGAQALRSPWAGLSALAKGVARGVSAYRRA